MLKTFVKIRLPFDEKSLKQLLALNDVAKGAVTLTSKNKEPFLEKAILPKSAEIETLPDLSIEDKKRLAVLEQGTLVHGETPLLNLLEKDRRFGRPPAANSPMVLAKQVLRELPKNEATICELVRMVETKRPDMPRGNIRTSIEKLKNHPDIVSYKTDSGLIGLRLVSAEEKAEEPTQKKVESKLEKKSVVALARQYLASSQNKTASIVELLQAVKPQRPDLKGHNIRAAIHQLAYDDNVSKYLDGNRVVMFKMAS